MSQWFLSKFSVSAESASVHHKKEQEEYWMAVSDGFQ